VWAEVAGILIVLSIFVGILVKVIGGISQDFRRRDSERVLVVEGSALFEKFLCLIPQGGYVITISKISRTAKSLLESYFFMQDAFVL
jgi:hypothetical protein